MKLLKYCLVLTSVGVISACGYYAYNTYVEDSQIEEYIADRAKRSFNIRNITDNDELINIINDGFDGITFLVFMSADCDACTKLKRSLDRAKRTFCNKPVRVIYVYICRMPINHGPNEILVDPSELKMKISRTPTTCIIEGKNRYLHSIMGCAPHFTHKNVYHEMINFNL